MSKNIVEKAKLDKPLMLYNRSTQRSVDLSSRLPAGQTEVIETLEDGVAKADIIFTCLANDAAGMCSFKDEEWTREKNGGRLLPRVAVKYCTGVSAKLIPSY